MSRLLDTYRAEMRVAVANQMQYRGPAFLNLVGFMLEPTVYLVVWRTVAEQGGPINGYGVAEFTAYYIVWTLVRVMNLALAPGSWDWWIQTGRISNDLLHPVHIYHRQLATFAGFKIVWLLLWIPVAGFLGLVFRPSFHPTPEAIAIFFVAIWLGYVIRFNLLFLLGNISFWTTKAQALIEVMIAAEILLSGRLVPMAVMPDWVANVSDKLPFKWTFQYPIEVLIGRLSPSEALAGLGFQVLWAGGLGLLIMLIWRRAIRRFTAVGT